MSVLPTWNKTSLVKEVHPRRRFDHEDSDEGIISPNIQLIPSDTGLLWGALAFTLRMTRFFGIAPISFVRVRSGCWKVRVSPLMCIYSYIFIFVLNLVFFIRIGLFANSEAKSAARDEYGWLWLVDVSVVATISTFGIVGGPSKVKRFIVSLDHVNKVLSTLDCEHIMRRPEKLRCWIIFSYILGVISMFIGDVALFFNSVLSGEMTPFQFCLDMFDYLEIFIMDLLVLQFFMTAMLPNTALKCINDELAALPFNIEWKNSAPHCTKIRRLSLAYSAICDVVRQVDESNGIILLLFLVTILMHLVISPFYAITLISFSETTNFKQRLEFVIQIVWCIYHATQMMMIVEPGCRMQQEIDKTQTLVGQLINRGSSPKDLIVGELKLFHKQILLNPVVFSPLGMCILSRPLIASILGAVTTYLVILVQFKNFSPNT